jgi:hypothetical protein
VPELPLPQPAVIPRASNKIIEKVSAPADVSTFFITHLPGWRAIKNKLQQLMKNDLLALVGLSGFHYIRGKKGVFISLIVSAEAI